jgi:hypothetical protein
MNLTQYLESISFRFVQPQTRLPPGYGEARKLLSKLGLYLDVLNTRLANHEPAAKRRLRELCRVPRMSTIAIGAIIDQAVAQMPPDQAYVNIGVWNGFTFLAGLINNPNKTCIGVDNFCKFGGPRDAFLTRFQPYKGPRHQFYDLDYREYFATIHKEPIGVYLYDGPHTYEDQVQGLQIAEPFFAPQCVVLVDDTNGDAARRGTMDFIARSQHAYRVLMDRRTARNCHPTFWNGIVVLQRED